MQVTLTPAAEAMLKVSGYDSPNLAKRRVIAGLLAIERESLARDAARRPATELQPRVDALNALSAEHHHLWGWEWGPPVYRIIQGQLCSGTRLSNGCMGWYRVGDSEPICVDLLPTG